LEGETNKLGKKWISGSNNFGEKARPEEWQQKAGKGGIKKIPNKFISGNTDYNKPQMWWQEKS